LGLGCPQQIVAAPELGSISSLPFAGSGRLLQELGRFDPKDISELADDLKPDIGHALLQFAHIGPVDVGLMRQILLRNALRMPKTAQVDGEGLAQIHDASRWACRLLTNRFKAT
jgi:hypothetical protein